MENNEPVKSFSAGGVVVNRKGLILVVNQKGDSWSLPKGRIEEGEEPLSAAQREIYEESGINDLEFIKHLGRYERLMIGKHGGEDPGVLKIIQIFLFHTNQENLSPIDSDNPEARWVEKDAVADLLTHPKDKEFFLQVKEKI